MHVSIYPKISEKTNGADVPIKKILKAIKSGKWRDQTEGYRRCVELFGKKSEQAKSAKKSVPYFTASGTFSERAESGLLVHSGFLALDFDDLTKSGEAESFREELRQIPFIFSAFLSIGGKGVCALTKINPEEHARTFSAIERWFVAEMGITLDPSAKDVSRARFITHDPDLWVNEESIIFDDPKKAIRNSRDWSSENRTPEQGVAMAIKWVEENGIQCEEGSYHNFRFQVACICNRLGISQSELLSSYPAGYEKLASDTTNAVSWVYRNNKSEHGASSQYMRKRKKNDHHQFYANQNPADPAPEAAKESSEQDILIELKSRKLTPGKMPPEPEAFVSVYGGMIASARNILVISGPSKSGKSAVGSAMIAGAMAEGRNAHTMGMDIKPNVSGKAMIYIDTEQSWYNFNRNGANAVRRALRKKFPPFYHAYWLKGMPPKQKLAHTWAACRLHAEEHGGIHMIFIDGIGDYVMSVNNEEVCLYVVEEFGKMAEEFDCPMITVLHKNPGSDKQRGWLGTIVQMKAEGVLSVDFHKETAISTISYQFLRNAGVIPEINFKWDTQSGYHRFDSYDVRSKAMADQFTAGDSDILAKIFIEGDAMPIESMKMKYVSLTNRSDGFDKFSKRVEAKGLISSINGNVKLLGV